MATYESMKSEVRQYMLKIQELDADRNEHSLVVNTIKDLDPNRRCFRLIGGVLVERTIKEVLPAVKKNLEGIHSMIQKLTEVLKKKQEELDAYQEKYDIKPARQLDQRVKAAEQRERKAPSAKSGGVLA
uniref:Prefoldin subunit 2 n=1 Tax=Lotharella oceanica TaxID=641309 RepID=A0A7S2XBN2_9EUKA